MMALIFVKILRKMTGLRALIEQAWDNRSLLEDEKTQMAIREVIDLIDLGELRCAEPTENGWQINEWVKKAVVLYFPIQKMEVLEAGIFEYHDKIPLKRGYKEKGVRVVPHAVARHGAYISKTASFSTRTPSTTIHLEPINALSSIITGAACNGSKTPPIPTPPLKWTLKGRVPARSVVIPGSYTKNFPAGDYQVPCALIIGKRKESTDKKTSLNNALREHNVAV